MSSNIIEEKDIAENTLPNAVLIEDIGSAEEAPAAGAEIESIDEETDEEIEDFDENLMEPFYKAFKDALGSGNLNLLSNTKSMLDETLKIYDDHVLRAHEEVQELEKVADIFQTKVMNLTNGNYLNNGSD